MRVHATEAEGTYASKGGVVQIGAKWNWLYRDKERRALKVDLRFNCR